MKLTRDDLIDAFPALVVFKGVDHKNFERLLAAQLCSFTSNAGYAADIASVLMSIVNDHPYNTLPRSLMPYRATIDIMLSLVSASKIKPPSEYLRAIALAMRTKRNPGAFRRSLCACARAAGLAMPEQLRKADTSYANTSAIRFRLPDVMVADIRIRAEAVNLTVSGWVRDAIYEKLEREEI